MDVTIDRINPSIIYDLELSTIVDRLYLYYILDIYKCCYHNYIII